MFRGLRCWAQQATVRRIYKEILWPCISKTWKRHLFTPWRPKFGEKMVTDKKLSYRASCPCFSPMNGWAWRPLQRHGHKKKRIFDGWLWPHAARDSHVAANTTVLQCTRLIATKDGYRAAMTQKIDLAVFWDLFQSVSVSIRTWKLSLACKTWRNFGQSRTWTAQGYPLQKAGWVLASCHEDWRLGSQLLGVTDAIPAAQEELSRHQEGRAFGFCSTWRCCPAHWDRFFAGGQPEKPHHQALCLREPAAPLRLAQKHDKQGNAAAYLENSLLEPWSYD